MQELILELSHNCNLSCVMCGFGGKAIKPELFMSWEVLERVFDQLIVAPKRIRLNGRGESTIHPDFINILSYVQNRYPTSVINLFTNLSVSNPQILQAFVDYDVQLYISMDSPDAECLESIRRGCRYDVILGNLDQLKSMHTRPFLVFTMQETNLDQLIDMAHFAAEREMNILFNTIRRDEGIEPFVELVKSKVEWLQKAYSEINELFMELDLVCHLPNSIQGIDISKKGVSKTYSSSKSCPALHNELCVLFDGRVTPCNMFNPYEYGNIIQEDLPSILSGEKRRWFMENNKTYYYCENCACMGGTS